MKGTKQCINWLMDNSDSELTGQRSGNRVSYNTMGFVIVYGDGTGDAELTNFNVFNSEDWKPASQMYSTWNQARYWMESNEGSNIAECGNIQYVIINNQLRKVDLIDGDSYTTNFYVNLTDDDWKIC